MSKRLRAAIKRKHGSVRAYAKVRAGPRASEHQVEAKRRQLQKWLKGDHVISDPLAEDLARELDEPLDAFKTPPKTRESRASMQSRLEAVEAAMNALGPELKRLGNRVATLERQAPPRTGRGG